MWVGFICLESARWGKTWILREFLEVIWFISLLFSCGLQFLLIVSIEIFSPVIVFHFHEPTFKSAFFFSWQLKMFVWFFLLIVVFYLAWVFEIGFARNCSYFTCFLLVPDQKKSLEFLLFFLFFFTFPSFLVFWGQGLFYLRKQRQRKKWH